MNFFPIVLLFSVYCTMSSSHGGTEEQIPRLIIVSFDGFRWDYLSKTDTPNFDRIIFNGVRARNGMKPVFYTKTLPNHMTLATGLFEENHGIVANTMFDSILNETFNVRNLSQRSSSRWFDTGGEPIWVTNQVSKHSGRSGCVMWIGCDAYIKGIRPTRHIPFDANFDIHRRIDTLIGWFNDVFSINLGLLYYREPDATGHKYGPDSVEMKREIRKVDEAVGYLMQKMEKANMLSNTNLIITSDHGFSSTNQSHIINLDDYVLPDTYRTITLSPVASILPNNGKMCYILSP